MSLYLSSFEKKYLRLKEERKAATEFLKLKDESKAATERPPARLEARIKEVKKAGVVHTLDGPPESSLSTTDVFEDEQAYYINEFRRSRGFVPKHRNNVCVLNR